MIFDNLIIFDEEQVGQVGNKVAPGQHNAMLWRCSLVMAGAGARARAYACVPTLACS